MPKIDFAELSAVANSINGAVMDVTDSLNNVKEGANDLVETSELDSNAWSSAKNYFQTYPVLADGIWNSAMTVSETLSTYLTAFQSEVGSPKNQLDTDKLEEMQSKLTSIQSSRRNLIESMSKAEDYVLSNLSNRLSGLDTSAEYFTKEIEVLTKYKDFEAGHANDFDDVQSTIGELKAGMTQISTRKNFDPIRGYAQINYKAADWFTKVSEFNSNQPECRIVFHTIDIHGKDKSVTLKVYKNGVVDEELTEKTMWLFLQEDLIDLLNVAGEVSGVYDGYRFFVGKDPVTGESISFEKWMEAGFWTALEVLSAAKMLDMLKNIKLNKKLLNGIALTEDELRLFAKLDDLGAYKTIEKLDDIIKDGSHYVDGKLKPNTIYVTGENKYLYETDSLARIVNATADDLVFKTHKGRLKHDPNTPGKLANDDAGHIFADLFGGSPELDNLISMERYTNRWGEYRKLEQQWEKALNAGQKVSVDIKISYVGDAPRPNALNISYTIDGNYFEKNIVNVGGK
ncbi:DNA/RNA non-specific endonuclease [Enterococcus sp. BWM-S5]|uniref:DNA/RNA non-specific endonuclease n=1 Tax=Enterococcus larvae TaxID=2794352 RepID=A0ABS4CL06_9ENTE|nr:DNA/RNA non-specific endonuclease [Enterococcus larvae]MBP1047150.1 DNA/RNA non-specific endonuclease [Enterococcus larvae]